ncbi:hypothetical protein OKA04_03025 [Luteolibacter flavescens]|uniref:Uncharacterized protein n=1 Tax=Luteolibacter flavescens TaxID=1859460 RepID=A0ABT3FKE7_9BACT|nr:hypothetical protein [Luteolibacter flavescens]MCW1883684.1 hypothetical protein [Luteolibacter flavescens]
MKNREAIPSPTDLVSLGREQEAANLAATREQRELKELSWLDQVAAAREKLPPDADFAALAKAGMAAAKATREHASAETVAAFGKWLELDPDAALDFFGKASHNQSTDAFRFELGDWLGKGNEYRFGELTKRFPRAALALRQGAQALCHDRGADFTLQMASGLADPSKRLWLLYDCLEAEQWQGHLAKIPALLGDRQATRKLLSSIFGSEDSEILLAEIRDAGFAADDVALVETQVAEQKKARFQMETFPNRQSVLG